MTCDALVMFGATGDLARQKLFVALSELAEVGAGFDAVIGVGRSDWSDDRLRDEADRAIRSRRDGIDEDVHSGLLGALSYVRGDTDDAATFETIADRLSSCRRPLVYLGLPPTLFAETVAGLASCHATADARFLVEKPYGLDRASADELSDALLDHVDERQLFRIDHFLTKESIQDLLVFRFANRLVEPVWHGEHVESVRIVMSEEDDVSDRASFYDGVGAIRDVLQNHLLQLVATLAMDPPTDDGEEAVRAARTALLRSVRPLRPADIAVAQYEGYLDTDGVVDDSPTETFVRARLHIDNDRWRDVPWTIETGKALALTETVVDVRLRPVDTTFTVRRPRYVETGDVEVGDVEVGDVDGGDVAVGHGDATNRIVLEIKPEPAIRLVLQARTDDLELTTATVTADLDPSTGPARFDAYARLFDAARSGDHSVFAGRDEIEAAWDVVDGVLGRREAPARYPVGSDVRDVRAR